MLRSKSVLCGRATNDEHHSCPYFKFGFGFKVGSPIGFRINNKKLCNGCVLRFGSDSGFGCEVESMRSSTNELSGSSSGPRSSVGSD